MDKLNVAVIGLGTISSTHNDAIKSYGANLAAVCDVDEEKMQNYGCKKYKNYIELLKQEDIDVVHICTPHYLHPKMTIDSINAGKYVVVEKPIATSSKDLLKIIENKNSNKVCVCFQNRLNNGTAMLKDILSQKTYGEILGAFALVPWYRDSEYYAGSKWRGKLKTEGGCLLVNQAIHTIDLMQYLVGEVEKVKAHVDNYTHQSVIEGEDTATAALYYKSGIVGMFFATNCYNSGSTTQLEISCEKAKLKLTESGLYIDNEIAIDNDNLKVKKSYYGNSHEKLIHEFYNEISGKGGSHISAKDALHTCKIVEAIYESSKQNKTIMI